MRSTPSKTGQNRAVPKYQSFVVRRSGTFYVVCVCVCVKMAPTMTNIPEQIEKYIRDSRLPVDFTRPLDSPMVNFYSGRCVFLTGGTGFLGQLFVEKLLRTGVRRVYVLARPKRGRSTADRLRDTFAGDVFARLLADDPRYLERVRAVDGDMGKPQMGISPEDWAELVANVHIVLHSAAEVRFDESLKHLLLVNLRGTREVLRLAEACVDLAVFAHISTAYSHCPHERIDEEFYEVPYAPKLMIDLAEGFADGSVNERQFHELNGKVIEPWPNTYTFTKALAEQLVREFGERIPVVVMRPSIGEREALEDVGLVISHNYRFCRCNNCVLSLFNYPHTEYYVKRFSANSSNL